jgi:hypothetical protein
MVEDQIADRSPEAIRKGYIIPWVVRGKNGTETSRWVVNWPRLCASDFKKKGPFSVMEWYQPFEQSHGPYERLEPKDQQKWLNTVAFVNAQLG